MRKPSKQTLGMFALAGIIIAALFVIGAGVATLVSWNVHGRGLSTVSAVTGNVVRALDSFARGFTGRDDSLELERINARLRSQLAGLQDVEEENVFLRNVAELPTRYERRTLIGGVFNYAAIGQQMRMVLNMGFADGVEPGSTVTTESGSLLGIVDDVGKHTSSLIVLDDPSIQITGRVMNTDVGGLVRVDQTGQLALELIGKDEEVAEGAMVVTSGLDTIPAGIPIGIVRSVDSERTTLFQIIRIDAAYRTESVWRVLVFLP